MSSALPAFGDVSNTTEMTADIETHQTSSTLATGDKVDGETTASSHCTDESFPVPASQRPKLSGWQFYEHVLGSPRLVVAPMVDQSELAWRMLSRRHGAQLCYSPMYHSSIFAQDPKYRLQALQSCPADRPLIIQFCGNEPDMLLRAALLAQDHCDAVDINLGCPQAIAKRGHYGAFLQDEWPLLESIVRTLHERLAVPVTCKIRIFDDPDRTVRYAQMLERAGCQLLTVHGRTREQKGALTGVADWTVIRRVRQHVSVPMFANGNIMGIEDVHRCLEATGVQGVMTAEGNLHNPAIFDGLGEPAVSWRLAEEYFDLVEQYPCPVSYVRGHMFKMFHHLLGLAECAAERQQVAVGQTLGDFRQAVRQLRERFEPMHEGQQLWTPSAVAMPIGDWVPPQADGAPVSCNLSLPPWLCQPYVRLEPDEHRRILAEKEELAENPLRIRPVYLDDEGNQISRKLAKKLKRVVRRPNYQRGSLRRRDRALELCSNAIKCGNPVGLRCDHVMCRLCCKEKCYSAKLQCVGHKFWLQKKAVKLGIAHIVVGETTTDTSMVVDETLLSSESVGLDSNKTIE